MIPIKDEHFDMLFENDKKILEFLLCTVPLACQDQQLSEKLLYIGGLHRLPKEEKLSKVINLKDNLTAIREQINVFIDTDDEVLLEWLNTSCRYISLFTKPYIKQ